MRRTPRPLFFVVQMALLVVFASCTPRPSAEHMAPAQGMVLTNNSTEGYRIKPGDVLKVEFANHPEYTRGVTVRPDSMITLPEIGDVKAGGRSPSALARDAQARYERVLKFPKVTVELVSSPHQVVYIGGEVKTPGMYPVSPGKTALQTVLEAGGPTTEASKQHAFLLRDQGTAEPLYVTLDLTGVNRGFQLQPKDILVVPKSGIANANQFVDQYINKLIPFQKTLGVTYFVGDGIE